MKVKVNQIDAKELFRRLESGGDFVLLDVRTPQEFERGKIKGAVNLPLDKVKDNIEKIIPDKKRQVYLYCLSGSRSKQAADQMLSLGFQNVFDLKNGLLAWRVSNFGLI